jgi:hypothetical protein
MTVAHFELSPLGPTKPPLWLANLSEAFAADGGRRRALERLPKVTLINF